MRWVFVTALFLVASITLGAQTVLPADTNPSTENEIRALESKLAELIVHGNVDEYASHLSSDYFQTRENGRVESRDETLASLRDGKRKIIVMENDPASLTMRVYHDAAVTSSEFTVAIRNSGQVRNRRMRFTDVLVKREGQWIVVERQESALGK